MSQMQVPSQFLQRRARDSLPWYRRVAEADCMGFSSNARLLELREHRIRCAREREAGAPHWSGGDRRCCVGPLLSLAVEFFVCERVCASWHELGQGLGLQDMTCPLDGQSGVADHRVSVLDKKGDSRIGTLLADLQRRLNSIQIWHVDVENDDIRELACFPDGFLSIAAVATNSLCGRTSRISRRSTCQRSVIVGVQGAFENPTVRSRSQPVKLMLTRRLHVLTDDAWNQDVSTSRSATSESLTLRPGLEFPRCRIKCFHRSRMDLVVPPVNPKIALLESLLYGRMRV